MSRIISSHNDSCMAFQSRSDVNHAWKGRSERTEPFNTQIRQALVEEWKEKFLSHVREHEHAERGAVYQALRRTLNDIKTACASTKIKFRISPCLCILTTSDKFSPYKMYPTLALEGRTLPYDIFVFHISTDDLLRPNMVMTSFLFGGLHKAGDQPLPIHNR